MHRMHAVHSLDQRSTDLFIGCGDGSRRRPQCPVNVLGIPAREQNMLEVGSPELGEYWGSGGEQSFCVSNAMECWVCELLVDGDTGAVAQKEGAPTFSTDVCPGVDVDSVHNLNCASLWVDLAVRVATAMQPNPCRKIRSRAAIRGRTVCSGSTPHQ